jgi:hypothetical protein
LGICPLLAVFRDHQSQISRPSLKMIFFEKLLFFMVLLTRFFRT